MESEVRKTNKLKQHRIGLGLTQQDIQAATGIHQVVYGRYEIGSRKLSPEAAKRLAPVFGCKWYILIKEQNEIIDE